MKAAVYCGTRNVYQDMIPSMKSLLMHSDVNKIYFLIEDDVFPYDLPSEVECINIKGQQWFSADTCPNMKNRCSYMVLLRVVFSQIFPHLDRILTIDNDTIVRDNISELWDLDLEDYYLAGCSETQKSSESYTYINMGVAMLNLKKWREDGLDAQLVEALNTYYFVEAEQSAINEACQGKILVLDSMYNRNNYTSLDIGKEKIIHFAAVKGWQSFPIVEKYRNIEVTRNQTNSYGLDIIIPHYNNVAGLRATIESIYDAGASITVIDDCSTKYEGYEELMAAYPHVSYLQLPSNSGPGAARQYGLERTNSSHVMFIDAGDYVTSKNMLQTVLEDIVKYTVADVLCYTWFNEEDNNCFANDATLLQGKVFSREFIELYHLCFSGQSNCSYSNEDRGFMAPCKLALEYIMSYSKLPHFLPIDKVLLIKTFDAESITHASNGDFYYYKHISGFVHNAEHTIAVCRQNDIPWVYTMRYITWCLVYLYECYLRCVKECPDRAPDNLNELKYFYKHVYRRFEKVNGTQLQTIYLQAVHTLSRYISPIEQRININRFLRKIAYD